LLTISPQTDVVVFAPKGGGKTTFIRDLVKRFKGNIFIYDYHHEYQDLQGKNIVVYLPHFSNGTLEQRQVEMSEVVKRFVKNKELRIQLFVVSEADEYFPSKFPLPDFAQDIANNSRHYGFATVYDVRRPYDLNSKIVDLCYYKIFFKLWGAFDLRYCEEIKSGLSQQIDALGEYEYIVIDGKGNVTKEKPVML
jgi:hypothetical protein